MAALLLALLAAPGVDDRPALRLRDGDRLIFFGDSITQAGHYVAFVEAYLLARFPDRRFEVLNHGISSETISGTSEPDHDPRRPDAHDRFDRDVAAWKPDVVFACFGMNDGNYHPFDEERFARYRDGVRRLIDRSKAIDARLILMTPPPFDPYRRQVSDPSAKQFGYRFPAIDYDDTLARYAAWLVSQREEGIEVIDLHTALNAYLRGRRSHDASFHLAADGVHPDVTGHLLMAREILLALDAPAASSEVANLDAAALRVESGRVSELARDEDRIEARWTRPRWMPMPDGVALFPLELEQLQQRLHPDRLVVSGLPPGRYGLHEPFDGGMIRAATYDAEVFAAGIPFHPRRRLFPNTAFPLDRLREARRAEYDRWRAAIADGADGFPTDEERARSEALREGLRRAAEPVRWRFAVEPAGEEVSARGMHEETPFRGPGRRPHAGTIGTGGGPRRGTTKCRSRNRASGWRKGRSGRPR